MSLSEIKKIFDMIDIHPGETDNRKLTEALPILFQLVERLSQENEKLKENNQKLRDEISLLKGEQGKPKIRGNKKPGKDISSEKERKKREKKKKKKSKAKKHKIKINRTEICKVDQSRLPKDAVFKGYESVVVQEILIKTDNIEYKKEVFYSATEQKTYVGQLPVGITGEFGPGVRSLVCTLKHVGNMSEPKILELLENCGIFISQSTISRILTNDESGFNKEKEDIFHAALKATPFHQIDDTTVRVNGKNQYSQILCNPYYMAFFTVPYKNRLTILDIFLCGRERRYLFDLNALSLLSGFRVSKKVISWLLDLAYEREISEAQMQELLKTIFPDAKKGKNTRTRIMEAAAIASYHRQTEIPIIKILLSDDAPQFKKLTLEQILCWIHEGRHYIRLSPIVPYNIDEVKKFKTCFWDYYGDLLKYKENPNPETAVRLASDFDKLFSTKTGYNDLDDRIKKTKNKKKELLLVLKYPWLPLHNNASELGARVEKRRQDVSLQTKSVKGTKAKDSFLTITQTAKKQGVNAYRYIYDRISKTFSMPSLADLILQNSPPQVE